jgi:hypothetical protein
MILATGDPVGLDDLGQRERSHPAAIVVATVGFLAGHTALDRNKN